MSNFDDIKARFKKGISFGVEQTEEERLQDVALATMRLERMERDERFDPGVPGSQPTDVQQEIIDDILNIRYNHCWVSGGNQCLAGDTLVRTVSGGLTPIREIKIGDFVFDERGHPIEVVAVHRNGIKPVRSYGQRGKALVRCTQEHKFSVSTFSRRTGEFLDRDKKEIRNFGTEDSVDTFDMSTIPIGGVRVSHAYALGAMLGDGCKARGRQLYFSSGDEQVVSKVASVLEAPYRKRKGENYTWTIQRDPENLQYSDWFFGKYAHEKTVDITSMQNWDRWSLQEFVAGLLDTDGSLSHGKDQVSLSLSMQALPVLSAFNFAMLLLFGAEFRITADKRMKYKNGQVHTSYYGNSRHVLTIVNALRGEHLVLPRKCTIKPDVSFGGRTREGVTRLSEIRGSESNEEVFNITVDSPTNLYLLANGLVTSNSGKTATAAYIVARILREYDWKRPQKWHNEPLLILWAAKQSSHISESLLRKMLGFMDPGEYKIVSTGNIPQKIIHNNGNIVQLLTHFCASEAWEKAQSYTAHFSFCDELPSDWRFMEQMQRRIQVRGGCFAAFFTPIRAAPEIKKMIDHLDPQYAKLYKLPALANPSLDEEGRRKIIASMQSFSKDERRKRLDGDWVASENAVFAVEEEAVLRRVPSDYTTMWEHVEGTDPAINSAHGLVIMTRDRRTNLWYVVDAAKLSGPQTSSPRVEIESVLKITNKYNIVERACDPANQWFMTAAADMRVRPLYTMPYDKAHRRDEMLRNLMQALGNQLFIHPNENTQDLIDELFAAEWRDDGSGKIKDSSRYHLIDALIYAWDCRLRDIEGIGINKTWEQELREYNRRLKEVPEKKDARDIMRTEYGIKPLRRGGGKKKWGWNWQG